jgi:hypothetical protein
VGDRSTKAKFPAHASARSTPRDLSTRNEAGSATTNVLWGAGLVGLVVLGNHGAQFDVLQTEYASRQDCLNDWGDEDSCRAGDPQRSNTYFGPRYYWDPARSRPVVIGPDGSERVARAARVGPSRGSPGATSIVGSFARGGFGGIGRGFSSGHGG